MKEAYNESMDDMLKELDKQPLMYAATPREITVERLYPAGNYLNVRVGMKWSVGDENPYDVMKAALNMANQFHRENFPHFYNENGSPKYEEYKGEMASKSITKLSDEEKVDGLIQVINLTSSKMALEKFKPSVDKINNQKLNNAYNKQMELLTNKKD